LFATITIMADKPCRVGDRIVADRFDGFVEDIGLRSTKLRLLNGHVVTLPNGLLANQEVENIARRTSIRRNAEGIQFSLPLRHSYWKQDDQQGPLDVNLVRDGAQQAAESNERSN
jgi:small-conductance mechanosensitive channel